MTSEIWKKKINVSLQQSKLLLAILSPSYFKSEWCIREWQEMSNMETQARVQGKLPEHSGLIVPIMLHPLDRARFSDNERRVVEDARERQWKDFSSESLQTPINFRLVTRLTETIIDNLYELEAATSTVDAHATTGIIIIDTKTNLIWSGVTSPQEITFAEAKSYVRAFKLGGYSDWRLPTKKELKTLLDPLLLIEDPKSSPFPLREPFRTQRWGYLHSGTLVPPPYGEGANWIMNVRNGHIFNGKGYKAFVRPVRNP